MVTYVVQFVAGTQDLARASLIASLKGVRVIHQDESAIVFDAATRVTAHAQLPFANNVFVVLTRTPRRNLAASVRELAGRIERVPFPPIPRKATGFRAMVHIDGKLTPIDRGGRAALERAIATRIHLPVETRGGGQEYWVIGRRNLNTLLLCARLPKPKSAPRPPGSLAPELASMLVSAARIGRDETALDPFGGSGAIVEALTTSPAGRVLYSDTDLASHLPTMARQLKTNPRVKLLDESALELPSVANGSVGAIVTDPPWGEFAQIGGSYERFAADIAASFDRVLEREHGRFVVLIARRRSASLAAALAARELGVRETIGILVNGHPADVLIGGR